MRPIIQVWLKSDPVIFSQSCIFSHGCKQPEVKKNKTKKTLNVTEGWLSFSVTEDSFLVRIFLLFVILSPLILSYIKTTIVCVKMEVSLINIALI